MTMTYDEWKQKWETERIVSRSLEIARQSQFAEELSKESIFTRQTESIVDDDN